MFSQAYLHHNGLMIFLYNTWSIANNTAQGFYLCNVAQRVLRQHWTGFSLMQCCLEPQGHLSVGFFLCNVAPREDNLGVALLYVAFVLPHLLKCHHQSNHWVFLTNFTQKNEVWSKNKNCFFSKIFASQVT